jgi:hypothetical protein
LDQGRAPVRGQPSHVWEKGRPRRLHMRRQDRSITRRCRRGYYIIRCTPDRGSAPHRSQPRRVRRVACGAVGRMLVAPARLQRFFSPSAWHQFGVAGRPLGCPLKGNLAPLTDKGWVHSRERRPARSLRCPQHPARIRLVSGGVHCLEQVR